MSSRAQARDLPTQVSFSGRTKPAGTHTTPARKARFREQIPHAAKAALGMTGFASGSVIRNVPRGRRNQGQTTMAGSIAAAQEVVVPHAAKVAIGMPGR